MRLRAYPPILSEAGGPNDPVNLAQNLAIFSVHRSPRIVGQFNGNDLMVVKVMREVISHDHPGTEDLCDQGPHPMRDAALFAKFLRRNLQTSSKSFGQVLT